jgi:uncharacterized membrane protein YbaN (DUF454 family)
MRALYLLGGWASTGLATLGVVLPLLPTVPFLLLAAFCFARSSDRLHHWLVTHPRLGPPIADWRAHGAIRPRMKRAALVAILASVAVAAAIGSPVWALAAQVVVLSGTTAFILTRPDGPN